MSQSRGRVAIVGAGVIGSAAARVLDLRPAFRYSHQFAGVNCAPDLASSLGEALRAAGLPE